MIKFMGNGKRIEKVVRCLTSGLVVGVHHCKTGQFYTVTDHDTELASVVRFMTAQGYNDVYLLTIAEA